MLAPALAVSLAAGSGVHGEVLVDRDVGLLAAEAGEVLSGEPVLRRIGSDRARAGHEGLPASRIKVLQLVEVLKKRPELNTRAARDAERRLDHIQPSELRELVQHEEHRRQDIFLADWLRLIERAERHGDDQAQPFGVRVQAACRQDQINGRDLAAHVGEVEARAHQITRNRRRVEEGGFRRRRLDHVLHAGRR